MSVKARIRTRHISLAIASVSGFLALAFLVMGLHSYVLLICSVLAGSLIYAFRTGSSYDEIERESSDRGEGRQTTATLVTTCLFFVFTSLSLLTILSSGFEKPFSYYLFISLAATTIGLEIVFVRTNRHIVWNLLKSYILTLNVFLSNQLIFPYGIGGSDSPGQITSFIATILNTNHVPLDQAYSFFPLHHILVVSCGQASLIGPQSTYYFLGGFLLSFGSLFVFIVGRKMLSTRFGLVCALIYPSLAYTVFWAGHPAQYTFAIPLVIALFVAILFWIATKTLGFGVLVLVLSAALVFAHHYSSLVFLLLLVSVLLSQRLSSSKSPREGRVGYTFAALFGVMVLAHWIYFSNLLGSAVDIVHLYVITFLSDTAFAAPTIYDTLPQTTILLNTVGPGLLIALSTTAIFGFLRSPKLFQRTVVTITFVLALLIGIGILFPFTYILPNRLYVLVEILGLVFLGSYTLLKWLGQGPRNTIVALLLIFGVFFFSCTSTIAGFETEMSQDQAYVKLYQTPGEIHGIKWLDAHASNNSQIYGSRSIFPISVYDETIGPPFLPFLMRKLPIDENGTYNLSRLPPNSFLLLSEFDTHPGYPVTTGMGRFGHMEMRKLDEDEFQRQVTGFLTFYDNGIIRAYKSVH